MKIRTVVDVTKEIEVSITSGDIENALGELSTIDEDSSGRRLGEILNSVAQVLKAFNPKLIVKLSPEGRKIVANFLRESADKFEPKEGGAS